jgi:hypothetical protein
LGHERLSGFTHFNPENPMLLLKRLLTSAALFLPLLVVFYFAICMVGGGIAGARSGMQHPDSTDHYELGRQAGQNFVRNNIAAIALGSLGLAAATSLLLSFTGIFPWCRNTPAPPSLPPRIPGQNY